MSFLLFISLAGTPSPKRRPSRFLSPRDEEERRKILKMLVTPGPDSANRKSGKRLDSASSFDTMILKAARSAEHLPVVASTEATSVPSITDVVYQRKESSLSLQIPGVSPNSAILANKKVTFSHVVDQMACSLSDSSSLSDLSCAEDFKLNVSSSHAPNRRARKLLRSARIHSKRKHGTSGSGGFHSHSFNGTSGSEEVFESSMESIESSQNFLHTRSSGGGAAADMLSPGFRKSLSPNGKQLHKISSADSLLSMIKSLTTANRSGSNTNISSTPVSPQFPDASCGGLLNPEDNSSGGTTPVMTPDTPSSGQILGCGSPRKKENMIKVEIHDHPPASDGGAGDSDGSSSNTSSTVNNNSSSQASASGGMTLEVPGFHYGKCLSPIKELPSPLPTPSASPLPCRSSPHGSQDELSSSSSTSGTNSTVSSRRSSFRNRFRKKSAPILASKDEPDKKKKEDHPRISIPFMRRFSYAGDGSSLYQETSFVVPAVKTASPLPPPIPTITLTCHDSSEDLNKSSPDVNQPLLPPPDIQISVPAESPKEPPVNASQIPTNILIPQLIISCDDDNDSNDTESTNLIQQQRAVELKKRQRSLEEKEKQIQIKEQQKQQQQEQLRQQQQQEIKNIKSSSLENGSTKSKWRPPPIQIPNSNFLRRKSVTESAATGGGGRESKNETKDTSSTPREIEIELQEMKPTAVPPPPPPCPSPSPPPPPPSLSNSASSSACASPLPYFRSGSSPVTPPLRRDSSTSSLSSPTTKRMSLVKQREAVLDDFEEENGDDANSKVASCCETSPGRRSRDVGGDFTFSSQASVESEVSSPKPSLLNADSFDTAPRLRSQSVATLPEFRLQMEHDIKPGSGVLVSKLLDGKDDIHPDLKATQVPIPSSPRRMVVAATAITSSFGSRTRDERLALLLRQRSLTGSGIQTNATAFSTTVKGTKKNSSKTEDSPSSWKGIKLGSPTLKRDPPSFPQVKLTAPSGFGFSGGPSMAAPGAFPPRGSSFRNYDKPQSLDLPGLAPAITITPMSELESDGDSPVIKVCPTVSTSNAMHYLSPFPTTTHTCGSRTTSESNLSSSGYSSMASPGPSRSGSSNPLCISESEDTSSTPTSSSGFFSCSSMGVGMVPCMIGGSAGHHPGSGGTGGYVPLGVFMRRPSPLLKSPSVDSESSDPAQPNIPPLSSATKRIYSLRKMQEKAFRYR